MKPLVIYHGDCFDGFTAAWVWRRFQGDADFFRARYGEPPPDVVGRDVWILDFSYPRAVMASLIWGCKSIVIFDHHKTARAALAGIVDELAASTDPASAGELRLTTSIVFDMERSGAGITWDELSKLSAEGVGCSDCGGRGGHQGGCPYGSRGPGDHIEGAWLVNTVEDRDLWRMALAGTPERMAWIATVPHEFGAWDQLAREGAAVAEQKGKAVQAYIQEYGRKARAEATLERIGEHVVPAINLPYMNCSEHVGALLGEHPEAPFAAGYFRRRDGRWQFSLRSRPDFDVSEVAKMFGGGGHAGAAGFDVEDLWRVFRGEEA